MTSGLTGASTTVISAVAATPEEAVAVMVAEPSPTAVTMPLSLTYSTAGSEDDQVMLSVESAGVSTADS